MPEINYNNISDEVLDDLILQGAGGFAGPSRQAHLAERQRRRDLKEARYNKEHTV